MRPETEQRTSHIDALRSAASLDRSLLSSFRQLGEQIEAEWSALDYSEPAFPTLAAEALKRADLPSTLDLSALLGEVARSKRLPFQRDLPSRFGEPALTLYNGARFHIDVYVWFSSTTALHQHGFAGAFQVLEGASIHGQYGFETTRVVNPHFRLGRLRLERCERFERGAVQPIAPGSDYIHRLFHLDQPSATIVVRTLSSPEHQPQFSYDPPSVAYDPFFEDAATTKRLQCLGALFRAGDPSAVETARAWIADADLHTAFLVLSALRRALVQGDLRRLFGGGDDGRFGQLVDAARPRHGAAIDELARVFAEQGRVDQLVALRNHVTDPGQRQFLALLLNVDDRESIVSLVAQSFPGSEPSAQLLEWIRALGRTKLFGVPTPNALGIDGFDDLDLLIVEQLLVDTDDETIARTLVASEGSAQLRADELDQLSRRLEKLRAAPVFQPLLRRSID